MATATTKQVKKGFTVRCPLCGAEGSITIAVGDVRLFTCSECSEDFGPGAVRRLVEGWQALLAWVETAPEI